MTLKWEGDKVVKKVKSAVGLAINDTMTEAVLHAKNNHPWVTDTGKLERNHRIVKLARDEGGRVVGTWGVTGVVYAIYLEVKDKWRWLRPTADRIYPNLKTHLKRRMAQGAK